MKKLILTALIASMLIVPLGNTALAEHEEAPAPAVQAEQDYVPGSVPAETEAAEAMLPAVHGLVLAMLNHQSSRFDPADSQLVWESLYNMLSLYGQLDSRCDERNGELFLPEETVQDYAAALDVSVDGLDPLPQDLRDRMNYDNVSQGYILICGDEGPVQIQMDSLRPAAGELDMSGSLIYLANGQVLAHFRASLTPRDTMFGYAIAGLTVTD